MVGAGIAHFELAVSIVTMYYESALLISIKSAVVPACPSATISVRAGVSLP